MEYLKGITHCTFLCRDYEKMVSFYRDKLGLKQIFCTQLHKSVRDSMKKSFPELKLSVGEEWMTYLEIAPRNFIELFKISYKAQVNDVEDTGFHHICLLVDDIVAAARELERRFSFPRSGCWHRLRAARWSASARTILMFCWVRRPAAHRVPARVEET